MRILFYGIARQIGTSANVAAIVAGLRHYWKMEVVVRDKMPKIYEEDSGIVLTDCSNQTDMEEEIKNCDLFVINLSPPFQELEEVYFRHSLVRENVIFLIGKYYQNEPHELERLAKQYRIPYARVCAIPYSPRFRQAYEKEGLQKYLQNVVDKAKSYEDLEFGKNLRRALNAVITFGKRKGDMYYG